MKNKILFFLFITTLFSTFWIFRYKFHQHKEPRNILIISFCSISSNYLPIFGQNQNDLPNFKKFFTSSVNFLNIFGSTSWVNTGYYIYHKDYQATYKDEAFDYHPIMKWNAGNVSNLIMRIPPDKNLNDGYEDYYNESRILLPFENFDQNIIQIKEHFEKNKSNLFMIHFKLAHYPLLTESDLRDNTTLKNIFNKEELIQIEKYYKNPEQYFDKLSFFQYLFGTNIFQKKFTVNNIQNSYLTNQNQILKWKKSINYNLDLQILSKAYLNRLKKADLLLGKYLNFYQTIEKNTVMLVIGDHGETLGNRDYLSHSEAPYDEVIRIFSSVHFPGQKQSLNITSQISQRSIGRLIEGIAEKRINENNISTLNFRPPNDDIIASYSCSGDIASLRINNKWKFIHYFRLNNSQLFDLEKDKNEQSDISNQHPDLVEKYQLEIRDWIKERIFMKDKCIK